jgi:hypothetical protein
MDAKAGKLISVGGNVYYADTQNATPSYKYTSAQTEAVARSFASKILPEEMKMTDAEEMEEVEMPEMNMMGQGCPMMNPMSMGPMNMGPMGMGSMMYGCPMMHNCPMM